MHGSWKPRSTRNLVLASQTGNPFIDAVFGGSSGSIRPGQRNEFHAGFQQAFGKFLVVDADYLWKYTHSAYDFGVLLNTPIFFPIAWHNSKINGFGIRVSLPNYHGLTAIQRSQQLRRSFLPSPDRRLGHRYGRRCVPHRIMIRNSNRPRMCSTSRGSGTLVCSELAATTTAWSPGRCHSQRTIQRPWTLTGLTADQQIQQGYSAGMFSDADLASDYLFPVSVRIHENQNTGAGTQDDDHNPARMPRVISLMPASP